MPPRQVSTKVSTDSFFQTHKLLCLLYFMFRPCSGPFWLLLIVVCMCVLMGARAVAIRSRDGRLLEKSISGQKWPGTPCVIDYKSKYSIPGLFFPSLWIFHRTSTVGHGWMLKSAGVGPFQFWSSPPRAILIWRSNKSLFPTMSICEFLGSL